MDIQYILEFSLHCVFCIPRADIMCCLVFDLTRGTRTGVKKMKCQQSLVLIKHSVQTDSTLDACAAWELAVIENE